MANQLPTWSTHTNPVTTTTEAREIIAAAVTDGRITREEGMRRHDNITRVSREYRGKMKTQGYTTWTEDLR